MMTSIGMFWIIFKLTKLLIKIMWKMKWIIAAGIVIFSIGYFLNSAKIIEIDFYGKMQNRLEYVNNETIEMPLDTTLLTGE